MNQPAGAGAYARVTSACRALIFLPVVMKLEIRIGLMCISPGKNSVGGGFAGTVVDNQNLKRAVSLTQQVAEGSSDELRAFISCDDGADETMPAGQFYYSLQRHKTPLPARCEDEGRCE